MINEILFPPTCIGCGSFGISLCEYCGRSMREITQDWCLSCGNKTKIDNICHICLDKKEVMSIFAFWYYEKVVAKIIQAIKYKKDKRLIFDLLRYINPQTLSKIIILKDKYPNSFLVPVPLHSEREKERGFNQSRLIAESLGLLVNIKVCNNLVIRVKNTTPQARCTSKLQRIHNTQNAFAVNNNVLQDKTIIIVDDVITTGSTTREIARQIHKINRKSNTLTICLGREETPKENW